MENTYLQHHGILGQKWGIRRFQNKDGSLTSAGEERYDENDNPSSELTESSTARRGLSENQKRAIKIGAAVAVTAIAAVGIYQLNKHGKLDKLKELGKDKIDELFGKKEEIDIEAPSWIEDVNPNFHTSNSPEFKMNCGNCAIAYELQSRGVNASAIGNNEGMTKDAFLSHFKNINDKTVLDLGSIDEPLSYSVSPEERGRRIEQKIKKSIAKAYKSSDSARGALFVPGFLGSHYVTWEKRGSTVKFFNSQDTSRDLVSTCFAYYAWTGESDTSCAAFRLDDLDVIEEGIDKIVHRK